MSESVLGSFWEPPGTTRNGCLTHVCQKIRGICNKTCQKTCRNSRATPWATPPAAKILNKNQQKNWATHPHAQILGVRWSSAPAGARSRPSRRRRARQSPSCGSEGSQPRSDVQQTEKIPRGRIGIGRRQQGLPPYRGTLAIVNEWYLCDSPGEWYVCMASHWLVALS